MPRASAARFHARSGMRPRSDRSTGNPACRNAVRTRPRKSSRRSGGSSGGTRLVIDIKAASTDGRGWNADAGMCRDKRNSHHGDHPSETRLLGHKEHRFFATSYSTSRSARTSADVGSSRSLRRIAVVRANGMFPNALKSSDGSRTRRTSACTTVTSGSSANRPRSVATYSGSSSTAMTCAPASASAAVIRPVPAPSSSTNSPGAMAACATSSPARGPLRSRCCPLGRNSRVRERDPRAPTDHHREDAHRSSPRQRSQPYLGAAATLHALRRALHALAPEQEVAPCRRG